MKTVNVLEKYVIKETDSNLHSLVVHVEDSFFISYLFQGKKNMASSHVATFWQ